MNSEPVLEMTGLSRRYGAREALAPLDLRVERGEILGLAGPNGSGKTTLLRLVAGFARPSHGSVRVFGLDPWRDRRRLMARARFAFAPPPLYESLTAREHLQFLARLGVRRTGRIANAEIGRTLETVGLAERAHDRVRTFSFGMRQRLVLAQALLPRPELLVLDEPNDGLDPVAVLELRDILRRLHEESDVTILLASHLMVEIDRLVDRLVVLDEGRCLFTGAPAALRERAGCLRLTVDDAPAAVDALRRRGLEVTARNGTLMLPPATIDLEGARALLSACGVTLREFHEERPTLEQALLSRLRAARVRGEA